MNEVKIKSYAKVNLGLQVLNKRPDSYHNINTVFSRIDLFDQLTISESKDLSLSCNIDLGIPSNENLAFKAAEKFLKRIKLDKKVNIDIIKNIPAGGGLGGGSSNAAYTLLAIAELFDLKDSYKDMLIVAQSLGSDIPFFLKKGAAVGRSRGEKLEYFTNSLNKPVLIINPGIHVSTPLAYQSLNRSDEKRRQLNFRSIIEKSKDNLTLLKEFIINDFEKAVFAKHPEIKAIKEKLYGNNAEFALMSGSGSTLYGVFNNDNDANNAALNFNQYFNVITKFIN